MHAFGDDDDRLIRAPLAVGVSLRRIAGVMAGVTEPLKAGVSCWSFETFRAGGNAVAQRLPSMVPAHWSETRVAALSSGAMRGAWGRASSARREGDEIVDPCPGDVEARPPEAEVAEVDPEP